MKVAIISNVVEDEIINLDGETTISVGGPPFYCGLTARKYGIEVSLITKFGQDLDIQYLDLLKKNNIYFLKKTFVKLKIYSQAKIIQGY